MLSYLNEKLENLDEIAFISLNQEDPETTSLAVFTKTAVLQQTIETIMKERSPF